MVVKLAVMLIIKKLRFKPLFEGGDVFKYIRAQGYKW